eukprot:gene5267-5801_t
MEGDGNDNNHVTTPTVPSSSSSSSSLSPKLERVIADIARTGRISYEWKILRPLFKKKIVMVVESFFAKKGFVGPLYESYDSRLDNILTLLDRYDKEPPFTVQRLAELLIHADEEYRTTHALMYGLSKILSVHTLVSDYEDHLDSFLHEESLFI